MRVIISAVLITLFFNGCSDDSDDSAPQAGASSPTIIYTQSDGADKVSTLSRFIITTKDDLSALPEGETVVRLQALGFSHSDGYLSANHFDHSTIVESMYCSACHGEAIIPPEIAHYFTVAKEKILSGSIIIEGQNIRFRPDVVLEPGRRYRLSLLPVIDTNSQQLTPATFEFATYKNPQFNVTYYFEGIVSSSKQTIAGISTNDVFRIKRDADDVITTYRRMIIDESGKISETVIYDTAGVDDNWFNAQDNGVGQYIQYRINTNGELEHFAVYSAGPDKLKGNADDEVVQYTDVHYNNNKIVAVLSYGQPGGNGDWFDDDDQLLPGGYTKLESTIEGLPDTRRTVTYNTPGEDGLWYTSDDVVGSYVETIFNAQGDLVSTLYTGAGTGMWFDGNDTFLKYSNFDYYQNGLIKAEKVFNNTDQLTSRNTYVYDDIQRLDNKQEETLIGGIVTRASTIQYHYLIGIGLLDNITTTSYENQVVTWVSRVQYEYDLETGKIMASRIFFNDVDFDIASESNNVTTRTIEH